MNDTLIAGQVTVCMCCMPKNAVFTHLPHLKGLGLTVTHGICAKHKAEYLEVIARMKKPAVN